MKKFFVMGAALAMVFAMSSCKSQESAYRRAYEKARAQAGVGVPVTTTTTTPVGTQQTTPVEVTTVTPATTTTVTTVTPDYSNVTVREEVVSLVSGSSLRAYSVVVGSFSVQSNATALATKLQSQGYTPSVVKAKVNGTDYYRVVASSSDNKATAVETRNQLSGAYSGAWLLYQK